MSWVKIDDAATDHPKLLAAGPKAGWLWVAGLCYCSRQKRRDGFIPAVKVPYLYPGVGRVEAAKLVEVGLWEVVPPISVRPNQAPEGYLVHDFGEYQPRSDEDLRAGRARSGKKGGQRTQELRRKNEANVKQADQAPALPCPALPDQKKHSPVETGGVVLSLPIPEPSKPSLDFDAGYNRYPRKEGRKKGLERFKAQIRTLEAYHEWLTAIGNYAEQVRRAGTEARYIKHFDTFMNCWQDYVRPAQPGLGVDDEEPQEFQGYPWEDKR